MEDTNALSAVAFDDLAVGARRGPYAERVSAELAARLARHIGEPTAVALVPPAVYPVLFLKALRRSMGGIPAGAVLAKQELEFHGELPVDSDVGITTWVGERYERRGRPYAVIEFDVRDSADSSVVTGRKIIVWPNGPGSHA